MPITKQQINAEFLKGHKDPIYAIETYLKTFDLTKNSFVRFTLFEDQKKLINNYHYSDKHQITLKYRQAGVSTTTAAYCSSICSFALPKSPHRILIIANKLTMAGEFLNKIKNFIKEFPSWLNITFEKDAAYHFKLSNNCEVKAVGTSNDALRGYTPTLIIMDEAAFIDVAEDFWAATMASISTGGRIILISTPNGQDPIYYEAYESAINGNSNFLITHLKWYNDPRYNKGLKMVRTNDLVDYMLKPDDEKTEIIIENVLGDDFTFNKEYYSKYKKLPYNSDTTNESIDVDEFISNSIGNTKAQFKEKGGLIARSLDDINSVTTSYYCEGFKFTLRDIEDKISQGYKPFSPWYEKMARDMKYDKRKVNQELECAFNGSGNNVIESEIIQRQDRENVKDPLYKDRKWNSDVWIWAEPKEGHKYILAIDVSRGDSEDYTGMQIIDVTEYEQVVEYYGKIKPDIAAELVYEYAMKYNAISTFDITGGMGLVTVRKLQDMGLPRRLFHYDLSDNEMHKAASGEVYPGYDMGKKNKRVEIVAAMETGVSREEFKIRSARLIAELNKFVYINGRPDHTKGSHDDLIMSLGMALLLCSTQYKRLVGAEAQTTLNSSWFLYSAKPNVTAINTNVYIPDYGNKKDIVNFKPVIGSVDVFGGQKKLYEDLFGPMK